jgi:hypothetical protein
MYGPTVALQYDTRRVGGAGAARGGAVYRGGFPMPVIGRNTKYTRLDQLTDEQVQERWRALLPLFAKMLAAASVVMIGVFVFNHFAPANQKVTDFATVVFDISSIFTVCAAFLTATALLFGGARWKKHSPKR